MCGSKVKVTNQQINRSTAQLINFSVFLCTLLPVYNDILMVPFQTYRLDNGLRVVIHRDETTPMSVLNVLYDVGSRDEDPERTGFAHLFEHLMFEGSLNIPDFDQRLQLAGGENNAFTSNDITNYFMALPAINLETGLWLESDRMLGLAFSEEKLRIQKNVVTEEYRQVYMNQPYGDTMLLLRPVCYKRHPYQWATIGKSTEHIQNADLDEVRAFFTRFYHPANAIVSISSPMKEADVLGLVKRWFATIPPGEKAIRDLPVEPEQTERRQIHAERDVPASQIYMVFHTCGRNEPGFYATDLLNDVLAHGESSRLKERLVKKRKLFGDINAYLSGSMDTGMFVINGKLSHDVQVEEAEEAIWEELEELSQTTVGDYELQKVKNKVEASHLFSESNLMARTMNLAYYELMGDADLLNRQTELYFRVGAEEIKNIAAAMFRKKRATVMYYVKNGQSPDSP